MLALSIQRPLSGMARRVAGGVTSWTGKREQVTREGGVSAGLHRCPIAVASRTGRGL